MGLALAGCASPPRATMEAGSFRVSAEVPAGWRHLDLGNRHLLKSAENQIAFEDFGPVTREGIAREVTRARDLARADRVKTARSVLSMIRVPDDLFATREQARAFWDDWQKIWDEGPEAPPSHFDPLFARVLANVGKLADRDTAAVERAVLRQMGADARRDVASRERIVRDGRRGTLLVTWHRMTHDWRGQHVIFIDAGSAFGVWTSQGAPAVTGPVFDRVLKSLRFEPGAADTTIALK